MVSLRISCDFTFGEIVIFLVYLLLKLAVNNLWCSNSSILDSALSFLVERLQNIKLSFDLSKYNYHNC